tara:strand:+ start:1493 stop:2086 length:594 start_codon:yes stop_codon:yes gene_type:complete
MAKINIDLTTNVDISAREGDTFELDLGVTKEDGTSFDFIDNDIIFVVYGEGKVPVMLLNSGSTFPFYLTSRSTSNFVTEGELQKARAISKLIECDINLFTFVDDATFIVPRYFTNTNPITGNNPNVFLIQQLEGGIRLRVQAHSFNIPQGSYSYELKVASDLRDVIKGSTFGTTSVVDSYYKNSSTWMEGKFTINKN